MKKEYDVYFAGKVLDNWPVEAVKAGVGKLFSLSGAKLDALFSGTPIRVKKNLSAERAGRLRKAFYELGALVEVVPAGRGPANQNKTNASALRLAPVGVYSAPPPPPPPKVDISGLSLADPDKDGPHQPPNNAAPPPPDTSHLKLASPTAEPVPPPQPTQPLPDISHLQALPPNTGTLEDVAPKPAEAPLPDISRLRLDNNE